MISTVYIAAPYPLREAAIAVMHRLEDAGFEVTSTWLKQEDKLEDAFARLDLADVDRADTLVALNPPEWVSVGTGGRHVEFGYALARQKPIVMVGERGNIFHYLAPRLHFDVSCPEKVFTQVTAAIAPPPEMQQPPLWSDGGRALREIAQIAWPPTRG